MNTIWKYELSDITPIKIEMPSGAQIMTVAMNNGRPAVWALVDPAKPLETRTFKIIGTGWEMDGRLTYVGTWQAPPFVWHLFEQL